MAVLRFHLTALLALVGMSGWAHATRVKDIAAIEGVRANQLVGYGLVVGLAGTGDSQQTLVSVQTLLNLLRREGVTITNRQIQVRNVAAVMVTASLPAFARPGTKVDVQVSSVGDARSLRGGTLVMTPLNGGDGGVYAVAQGPLSIGGGFAVAAIGADAQSGHPTAGTIANGAIVEREVPVVLGEDGAVTIALHRPDFTTAKRVARVVNDELGRFAARVVNAGTVRVALHGATPEEAVDVIGDVERLPVTPDGPARVVLNERTGTVIIGADVRVKAVAIAHGALQVTVKTDFGVSQPAPFSEGRTVVVPDSTVQVDEGEPRSLHELRPGVSLGQLVAGLNALGVTPQDLIAILEAVKAAGALDAELEIM